MEFIEYVLDAKTENNIQRIELIGKGTYDDYLIAKPPQEFAKSPIESIMEQHSASKSRRNQVLVKKGY